MNPFKTQRDIENIHILLWLLKDNAWCHDWHVMGMAMVFPTLLVQIYLTWLARKDVHEIFHAIAVLCWIMANAIWMTGEFFYNDTWRFVPSCFFALGLASVFFYYVIHFRKREAS